MADCSPVTHAWSEMRILYHHRTVAKDGQLVHIEELIRAFRAQGHELRVVCPADEAAESGAARAESVSRLKRQLPRALYELLELAYSWIAYRQLAAAIREFKPDMIYERYNLFLLAGLMAKRRFGVPLLLEVNSPLVSERSKFGGLALRRLATWAEGTVWRGADFVLPVTRVLADFVRDYGVPDERIVVIPNGIDASRFACAPTADEAKRRLGLNGKLVLGFTGFVRDWHGVDRIIRWLGGPTAPERAFLLIVGDGPARPDLEALARSLDLAGRVRFTGVVPRKQIPELVAAFDVALQPAVTPYASPLKLVEYLALGKPVVAPRVPNIEEILVHDRNALLFDPGDVAALGSALTRICADPMLRNAISARAASTIAERGLTWDENARRVVRLIELAPASVKSPDMASGAARL